MLLWADAMQFLAEVGEYHRERLRVLAVPRLVDGGRRAEYIVRVRGELVPLTHVYRLSGILFQARAALDRWMFWAAHEDRSVVYTEKEDRGIAFPISETETHWARVEQRKYVAALGPRKVAALRSIQPFMTGSALPQILNDVHRLDKHRQPVRTALIADPNFVMVFNNVVDHPLGAGKEQIDFVLPNPALEAGLLLAERRTQHPMVSAGVEDVPIALVVRVSDEWMDVQDFLHDTVEFVIRASEILALGEPGLAEMIAGEIATERRRLAAFRRGMLQDDWAEWLSMSDIAMGNAFRRAP